MNKKERQQKRKEDDLEKAMKEAKKIVGNNPYASLEIFDFHEKVWRIESKLKNMNLNIENELNNLKDAVDEIEEKQQLWFKERNMRAIEIFNEINPQGRYYKYLQSKEWFEKRAFVMNRDNNICKNCGNKATLVHHKSYKNLRTTKEVKDCVALCHRCHKNIHRYE